MCTIVCYVMLLTCSVYHSVICYASYLQCVPQCVVYLQCVPQCAMLCYWPVVCTTVCCVPQCAMLCYWPAVYDSVLAVLLYMPPGRCIVLQCEVQEAGAAPGGSMLKLGSLIIPRANPGGGGCVCTFRRR